MGIFDPVCAGSFVSPTLASKFSTNYSSLKLPLTQNQLTLAAERNFHSVIWNLVQMATSLICCCAPIYRSIVPGLSFFGSLGSWVSQTFRSTSPRSKACVHTGANESTHSASSKESTKGSAKVQERSEGSSKHSAPREKIGETSSERDLA
jgi:hypothetical protein